MTDKKFLVQSFNKVKSVTTLDQFYEQCKSSMDRHWESTYESNKDILQDKKCVDVGIWFSHGAMFRSSSAEIFGPSMSCMTVGYCIVDFTFSLS